MNKIRITQDELPGMSIIAFAVIQQQDPEDLPNDTPNRPEQELPENQPDQKPEMPDQDDAGVGQEIHTDGENAFPEHDEHEIDQIRIDEQEETNGQEEIPIEPETAPSDLNVTLLSY